MIRFFILILYLFSVNCFSQQYISNNGEITFFSYAPIEDIKAKNKKVSAVYDFYTSEIVFQLSILDFNFRKKLMQTHFNENYLESDKYPKSTFVGKVIELEEDNAKVKGLLYIHGVTKEIEVSGRLINKKSTVRILSEFKIKLDDFNISIPKIVMYKIAEVISVNIDIELKLTE